MKQARRGDCFRARSAYAAQATAGRNADAPVPTTAPFAPASAPGVSSSARKRVRSTGPGSSSRAVQRRVKAEAGVKGRIADKQHRAMTQRRGAIQRFAHKIRANAEAAMRADDRERAEQQGGGAAGIDVPAPQRPDKRAPILRDERQAARREAIVAQALACLGEAGGAKGLIQQRLARVRVCGALRPDDDGRGGQGVGGGEEPDGIDV
jgi:hypothetical protein